MDVKKIDLSISLDTYNEAAEMARILKIKVSDLVSILLEGRLNLVSVRAN